MKTQNATITIEKDKLLALIHGFTKTSTDGAFYGICECCVAQGEACEVTMAECKETIYRYMTDIERGGNESSENS